MRAPRNAKYCSRKKITTDVTVCMEKQSQYSYIVHNILMVETYWVVRTDTISDQGYSIE